MWKTDPREFTYRRKTLNPVPIRKLRAAQHASLEKNQVGKFKNTKGLTASSPKCGPLEGAHVGRGCVLLGALLEINISENRSCELMHSICEHPSLFKHGQLLQNSIYEQCYKSKIFRMTVTCIPILTRRGASIQRMVKHHNTLSHWKLFSPPILPIYALKHNNSSYAICINRTW